MDPCRSSRGYRMSFYFLAFAWPSPGVAVVGNWMGKWAITVSLWLSQGKKNLFKIYKLFANIKTNESHNKSSKHHNFLWNTFMYLGNLLASSPLTSSSHHPPFEQLWLSYNYTYKKLTYTYKKLFHFLYLVLKYFSLTDSV